MELAELQKLFYDGIFEKDAQSVKAICQHIVATKNMTAAQHLAIYRNSILGKMSWALREIHPVCYRLVGKKFFESIAWHYLHRYPSLSPDIGDYGEHLGDFIADFKAATGLPYLPDVARLEWAWHRAFNAADEKGFDFTALSAVPESEKNQIVFRLPYSATLLASKFPIQHIWQVNQKDWKGDQTIDLDEEKGGFFLIWRKGYDIHIDLLDKETWQFLKAVEQQKTLSVLCNPETTPNAETLLPKCVKQGWIAGFSLITSEDILVF